MLFISFIARLLCCQVLFINKFLSELQYRRVNFIVNVFVGRIILFSVVMNVL